MSAKPSLQQHWQEYCYKIVMSTLSDIPVKLVVTSYQQVLNLIQARAEKNQHRTGQESKQHETEAKKSNTELAEEM